jgi:WD40 repeat protein
MLWDIDREFSNYINLKGHTSLVYCLTYGSKYNLLYSGVNDCTIKVWDCKADYECIRTIQDCERAIKYLILLPNGLFASGSRNNHIKIWDRSYKCINTIYGGEGFTTSLLFLKDYGISLRQVSDIFNN